MIFYAVASRFVAETIELFQTREDAERALETVCDQAPELADDVCIVEIRLEASSLN